MKRILYLVIIGLLSLNIVYSQPSAPTLSSPSKGSTQTLLPVYISWSSVSGADDYWIEVATDQDFNSIIYNDLTEYTDDDIPGLSNGTTYYWHVQAENSSGWGSYSATWNFVYKIPIPSAPTLSLPSNGSTQTSLPVSVRWYSVLGANDYWLQVSTNSSFTSLIYDGSTNGDEYEDLYNLSNGTTYYWHVSAGNSSGWSSYSSARNFLYQIPPPHITSFSPSNKGPAGGIDYINIYGSNFGSTKGNGHVKFFSSNINNKLIQVEPSYTAFWTDGWIECPVPTGASSGPVIIINDNQLSNDGQSDGNNNFDVSYGLSGYQWQPNTNGITIQYRVNSNYSGLTSAQTIQACTTAHNSWNNANALFKFAYDPTTCSTSRKKSSNDGHNDIFFGPPSDYNSNNTLAAKTWVSYNPTTFIINECDLELNNTLDWVNQYDLQYVVLHEFGHWLDLTDLYGTDDKNSNKVMYGSYRQTHSLTQDDIDGIQKIYGTQGTTGVGGGSGPHPSQILTAPTNLVAAISGQNVVLTWDRYTDQSVALQIVKNGAPFGSALPPTQTTYTDVNAVASLPATYKIFASKGSNLSPTSVPVSVINNISPSTISSNTNWDGIVYVNSNVTVSNNATLTISAGTNVLLGPNVKIEVQSGSKIIANGINATQGAIRFMRLNSAQAWDRILLLGSSNNQFSYCVFDGGGYANVYLLNWSNNNTFSYCRFKNAALFGINTDLIQNLSIDNCIFEYNGYGIVLWNAVGGVSINQTTINNNTGSGLYAEFSTITNFTNNKVENNGGNGIYLGPGGTIYLGKGAGSYESNYHTDYVPAAADNTEGAGAGRNRIKNNGNSYQVYVDVYARLYAGSLDGSSLIAGYNKISATSNLYIYNLAMTGDYENQQQWVVPASMTRWGENGSVSGSNFTGEVDYSYPLTFDPSINAGPGTVPCKVSNPANESKPITVLTSAIVAKISSTQTTSSQGEFLVDLKNKMIKVRNDFNDPKHRKFRPRLLGDLNDLSMLDPNDATQEKGMIGALLAEYRERLITNKSTTDTTEQLCNEAALVGESKNALRNGDISQVQELLKTYGQYVKNKDNVRSLLFVEMSVYEHVGDYAKAWEKLGAIKAVKPNDDLKKIYVAPSYKIMEERLQEKAKAAGIVLSKQESTEEEQQNTANEQQQPKEITLQNYPNPFNPSTIVSYQLSTVSNVKLSIFDIRGREIAVLQDGMKQAGHYYATFDASRLSSGIYFSRLTVNPQEGKPIVLTKKMLLMK